MQLPCIFCAFSFLFQGTTQGLRVSLSGPSNNTFIEPPLTKIERDVYGRWSDCLGCKAHGIDWEDCARDNRYSEEVSAPSPDTGSAAQYVHEGNNSEDHVETRETMTYTETKKTLAQRLHVLYNEIGGGKVELVVGELSTEDLLTLLEQSFLEDLETFYLSYVDNVTSSDQSANESH